MALQLDAAHRRALLLQALPEDAVATHTHVVVGAELEEVVGVGVAHLAARAEQRHAGMSRAVAQRGAERRHATNRDAAREEEQSGGATRSRAAARDEQSGREGGGAERR